MIIDQTEFHTESILHHINVLQAMSNMPYQLRSETTLNFKYKVDEVVPPSVMETIKTPAIEFYGIGRQGYFLDGGLKKPFKPKHSDMDLYQPLPFRVLAPNQSLTVYEQELYRLPVKKIINEIEYTCYYLKCIRVFKNSVDVSKIDAAGVESVFDLTAENLTPVPDPGYQMINVSGLTSHSTTSIDFNHLALTPQELEDIKKYFFEDDIAKVDISEWGLYSGFNDTTEDKAYNIQLAVKYCGTGTTLTSTAEGYSRNIKLTYGNKLLT